MFEKKTEELISRWEFLVRMAGSFGLAMLLVFLSLLWGSAGYHYYGQLDWIDAVLNASMILTGMGPVNPMTTTRAKVFATIYALYSGIAFLSIMAVMLTPVVHRLMHTFHLEQDDDDDRDE
jgi:hypothetical protein